ncbi:hypothetical protein BCR42DRAFT_444779 [Absidia repens]|uniref:Uncharacterized protein n=1 Tax=Absidia repens TaxID=90262 RepID=A0A1X2HE03_9FUNG|nr:hypothetical protein BCR42DRAFT_444779 [Absidia repens]
MNCPPAYTGQYVDIPNTISDHFFENHIPNNWDFQHYLQWNHVSLPATKNTLNCLVNRYNDVLSELIATKELPRELLRYLGRLKITDKAQFCANLLNKAQQQSSSSSSTTYLSHTVVNNDHFSGNVNNITSQIHHATLPQQQQQQQQPQAQPLSQQQQLPE